MAQYSNTVSFQAPSDFAQEQETNERQKRMAQMLIERGQKPIGVGSMVGNTFVPTSWTQKLSEALSAPLGEYDLKRADTRSKELASKQRQAYADELGKFSELQTGAPERSIAPITPNDDEGNINAPAIKSAVGPDKKAALAYALGAQNPALQKHAMDQLTKVPEWALGERFNEKTGQPEKFMYNKNDPSVQQPVGGQQAAKGVAVNGQLLNPATGGRIGEAVPKQADMGSDILIPDGKGGMVPNSQLIAAKKDIARSGASNVSVNTATKPFLTEIGKGAGEAVNNAYAGAQSAVGTLNNVKQIREGLGTAILGPGANVRIKLGQIGQVLGVNGKDDTEQLQNTRAVIQGLARQELSAAGQMKGQGQITESERGILRRAESGEVTDFTKPELETLLGALDKTARYRIENHNRNMQKLGSDPNAAGIVDYMRVDAPAQAPAGGKGPFKIIGVQ